MRLATIRGAMLAAILAAVAACGGDPTMPLPAVKDPATASKASIDRFSATAGHLFVRTEANPLDLPAANAPIDMDVFPFVTTGFGPDGRVIKYYNLDVQPTAPAPIFVLYREGESNPVPDQLNIVDVIPGDEGYNDFWQVMKVTVPANYVANSITSVDEIRRYGFRVEPTTTIVNCPIVPEGSTADLHIGPSTGLTHGWYKGMTVAYFNFDEAELATTATGGVPVVSIYVAFNTNGDPGTGFKTETGTDQTHNVAPVLPGDQGYTPLWSVVPYDNAVFDMIGNLADINDNTDALMDAVATVNCPIVFVAAP